MRLGGLEQHAHVIAGDPRVNGDRHHAVAGQKWPTRAGRFVDQAAVLLELARVVEPRYDDKYCLLAKRLRRSGHRNSSATLSKLAGNAVMAMSIPSAAGVIGPASSKTSISMSG